MASSVKSLFFDLIKVSLLQKEALSKSPTTAQWHEIFEIAFSQTLVGVLFNGIHRLPQEQRPPKEVLFQFFIQTENIKKCNKLLDTQVCEVCSYLENSGIHNVLIKGQGIARYYDHPELRTPGDIDLWVNGHGKELIRRFSKKRKLDGITYLHFHLPYFSETEVEVHYRASFFYNPLYNIRLQRYFNGIFDHQQVHKIDFAGLAVSVADLEFNRFYILQHIYRHFFGEGIGLRQMMDYYYVLKQEGTVESKQRSVELFRRMGMSKFLGASMWVMQEVFALEDKFLLCPTNEKDGRFLLKEIMLAGNFGKYDSRIDRSHGSNIFYKVTQGIKRNLRFVVSYPQEVLFDIPFRAWHYVWRKMNGWI